MVLESFIFSQLARSSRHCYVCVGQAISKELPLFCIGQSAPSRAFGMFNKFLGLCFTIR
jgi:hypothetical protein